MRGSILSTPQAAAVLGVSPARVRQLIAEGRLKVFQVGRGWAIYETDLRRFAAKARPNGRPRLRFNQAQR